MRDRGFDWDEEIAENWGIGVAGAGMFRGRLVIEIQNEAGELVGYAGRSLNGEEPKYLFPPRARGFHKSELLYGLSGVLFAQEDLSLARYVVLVEGFFSQLLIGSMGIGSTE